MGWFFLGEGHSGGGISRVESCRRRVFQWAILLGRGSFKRVLHGATHSGASLSWGGFFGSEHFRGQVFQGEGSLG